MIPRACAGLSALAVVFCGCQKNMVTAWKPGVAYPTPTKPVYRDLLDRRGLIHSHNIHSHDACLDMGEPKTGDQSSGTPNVACLNEFRNDLCEAHIDFDFLSDHPAFFDDTEYPDTAGIAANASNPYFLEGDNVMLYTQSQHDELVVRNGGPTANRMTCANGQHTLIMPGNEGSNIMPVGLEHHAAPDHGSRNDIYDINTESGSPLDYAGINAAIAAERQQNAVILLAHPEGVDVQDLVTMPLDGFEMYNLHANALFTGYGLSAVTALLANMGELDAEKAAGQPPDPTALSQVPTNPNMVFLAIFNEDPRYLQRWANAASQGVKRVMTMGSDCHMNSIPDVMSDGMYGDQYQRVMRWFSNHLLLSPNADGSWDDVNLKAALKAGRLYGAFEALGTPVGFDFHATSASAVTEMGGDVALSSSPTFSVKLPEIENLDKSKTPPAFTVRILRADGMNWDVVASGSGDLTFTPTQPGAYRAEVREIPYHLREDLGPVADSYLSHDYVWIYSNAIFVN
jgi:hypothetical protein